MPSLPYDSPLIYDSPDYDYNGRYIHAGTIKQVLWRELVYGGLLADIVPAANIKLDMASKLDPDFLTYDEPIPYDSPFLYDGSAYPTVVIRRVSAPTDPTASMAWERFTFSVIGSPNDDSLLETVADRIRDHFSSRIKSFGQYRQDGTPDTLAGMVLRGGHIGTIDMRKHDPEDLRLIVQFRFVYVR